MRTLIENLCGKLEDWDIDPILLVKSIGIFLTLVVVITLMVAFPTLFFITIGVLLSVLIIVVIYSILRDEL